MQNYVYSNKLSNNVNTVTNEKKLDDLFFSRFFVIFYYIMIINNVVKRLFGLESNIILILLIPVLLIYVVIHFQTFSKCCLKVFLLVFSIFMFFILISHYVYGNSFDVLIKYIEQGTIYILVGSALFCIKNYAILVLELKRNSYFFLALLSTILFSYGGSEGYVMSHSYLMLVPTLIHITLLIVDKKIINLPIIIFELYIILFVGSRGPLVVILIYSMLLIVFFSKSIFLKVIYFTVFALLLYLIYFDGYNTYLFLKEHGIESRSLHLLLTDLHQDSGREYLYDFGKELINKHPVIGYGIAGDATFLTDGYIHNIILELQIDFGKYLGLSFFIALNILYLIALYKTRKMSKDIRCILLLFIVLGYIPLFYSNSYLLSFDFYFSLFLSFSMIINYKRIKC